MNEKIYLRCGYCTGLDRFIDCGLLPIEYYFAQKIQQQFAVFNNVVDTGNNGKSGYEHHRDADDVEILGLVNFIGTAGEIFAS